MAKTKFFTISSYYPEVLRSLYDANPGLKDESYAVQYKKVVDLRFAWSDFWVTNLEKTGKFEGQLVIINNEFAQKKWAEEHQFKYTQEGWLEEILLEQIRVFETEIFFACDYVYLTETHLRKIKKEVRSIRKVIGWDGIGLYDVNRFKECDAMFSCGQQFVDFYQANGFAACLFQFAFEPSILDSLDTATKKYNVSFAGSLTLRSGGHHSRLKILGEAAKHFDVDYWLSAFDSNTPYLIKNILKKIKAGSFSDVADILRLWRINKGTVYGLDMYQVLASSKITINNHIDTAYTIGGNIRLWEATGVGACLVTDWKENIAGLFEPDKEIVVYQSKEECVEKIRYLLDHPRTMEAIAKAGQVRTLTEYSYEKRINQIVPFLLS